MRLFGYFKPYLLRAIIATLITIPIGTLDAAIAFSLKPYVDGMQLKDSISNAYYIPLVIVGFTVLQGLLNYTSIYLNGWLGARILADLRRDLFEKVQTLDVQNFDTMTSGLIISAYFRDPEALQTNILNYGKQLLTRIFSSIALMAVLLHNSWQLAIIAIVVMLGILYPSTQIRKIIKSLSNQTFETTGDVMSFYTETLGGIRVIYGYNLPDQRLKRFQNFQKMLIDQMVRAVKAQGWLTPSMHIIASVGVAIIIWQGSMMIMKGDLTTGTFVSFIAAMLMLYQPIKNLGSTVMNTQLSLMAAGRIFTLLDHQPSIRSPKNGVVMTGLNRDIELDNVSFEYLPDKPVLHDVSMTFKKGETVAIVGTSGGGKTTIINLIPRFYDVTQGAIRIDGIDVRDFELTSLRDQIAMVLQDNFLFDGTIRDNILMGKPGASEEEVAHAVEKSYLTEFVASLELGLDTRIGERGVMLSGGQKQRVAIARAILKDSPILILDEATSALDNQSEAIVQKALDQLMFHRTVIVIAHRLSTVRNADRIIVMEHGRISEQGKHEELLTQGGTYSKLYNSQFKDQGEATLETEPSGTLPEAIGV
ncbi:MAG: ABC transporter ATP-binding protein/permease [Cyanobacteria bacterium]|nr:ABC transporter ATP-binding protein/permease [Cyanobacteriota bacterium]